MILWTYVHDHTQTFVAGHGRLAAVSMGFSLVCEQSGLFVYRRGLGVGLGVLDGQCGRSMH